MTLLGVRLPPGHQNPVSHVVHVPLFAGRYCPAAQVTGPHAKVAVLRSRFAGELIRAPVDDAPSIWVSIGSAILVLRANPGLHSSSKHKLEHLMQTLVVDVPVQLELL